MIFSRLVIKKIYIAVQKNKRVSRIITMKIGNIALVPRKKL